MTSETPAARALRSLELIGAHPGIGAAELSRRLGVSARAVRRTVDTLRQSGLQIESVPGPGGGYRLARGALRSVNLRTEQVVSLVIALLEAPSVTADATSREVLTTLLAALPPHLAAPARSLAEASAAVPFAHTLRPNAQILLDLAGAVEDGRRVRISHRRIRDVEPWGIAVRHARWYLLAHDLEAGEPRCFRIDRIGDAEVLAAPITPPPADLDPAALLDDHLTQQWRHRTRVRIEGPPESVRRALPAAMGRLTPEADGTCLLEGSTDNLRAYALDLARCPHPLRIEEGEELRVEVRALAQTLADAAAPVPA